MMEVLFDDYLAMEDEYEVLSDKCDYSFSESDYEFAKKELKDMYPYLVFLQTRKSLPEDDKKRLNFFFQQNITFIY